MSCCGQRRTAWRQPDRRASTPAAPAALQSPLALAFTGSGPVVVRGAATGLTYLFPAGPAALDVDARDAPELLKTGRFVNA